MNAWKCAKCGAILGFRDGDCVRIKYKDLYVTISCLVGVTSIDRVCRKCGYVNVLLLKRKKPAQPVTSLREVVETIGDDVLIQK